MCKKAEAGQGQIEKAFELPEEPSPRQPRLGATGGASARAFGGAWSRSSTDWHCDSSATSQALLLLYLSSFLTRGVGGGQTSLSD